MREFRVKAHDLYEIKQPINHCPNFKIVKDPERRRERGGEKKKMEMVNLFLAFYKSILGQ